MAKEKGPVVEKTALNAADIYRCTGWGGSEMWPRLPDRLNVLFIVRFLSKILHRVPVRTRIYQPRGLEELVSLLLNVRRDRYVCGYFSVFPSGLTRKQHIDVP